MSGFAIRIADECEPSWEYCRDTEAPFVACCPESATCQYDDSTRNSYCCDGEDDDCYAGLLDGPRCADAEWDLFDNTNPANDPGYFCCEGGYQGYNKTENYSNGCIRPGGDFEDGQQSLVEIQPSPTSTSGSATDTPTGSATETPTGSAEPGDGHDDGGGTPVGAIAGGTVGGVALLAIVAAAVWWFLRKRRRTRGAAQPVEDAPPGMPQGNMTPSPGELDGEPAGARSKANQLSDQHGLSELAG